MNAQDIAALRALLPGQLLAAYSNALGSNDTCYGNEILRRLNALAEHNWTALPNGDTHCGECGVTVFAGAQAAIAIQTLRHCRGRPLRSSDFGSASGAIEAADAASERIAALESQLTAARRSVAELRALLDQRIAENELLRGAHPIGSEVRDCCNSVRRELLGVREDLDRLTEPSPAAPADDAKETP